MEIGHTIDITRKDTYLLKKDSCKFSIKTFKPLLWKVSKTRLYKCHHFHS